jgi:hypothetical protein
MNADNEDPHYATLMSILLLSPSLVQIFCQHPAFKHPQSSSPLNIRDLISHLHKTIRTARIAQSV